MKSGALFTSENVRQCGKYGSYDKKTIIKIACLRYVINNYWHKPRKNVKVSESVRKCQTFKWLSGLSVM